MREELYWKVRKLSIWSLFCDYFMYFDTMPYLADRLFVRRDVRVWFDMDLEKPGSPYLAVMCRVRKRDVPKFLEALEDLKRSMMLCGHPDYVREVSAMMDEMEKKKGDLHDDESDAAEKTEQEKTA